MKTTEQQDSQPIDLGVASEETKGGEAQILDSMQTLRRLEGISAD